MESSRRLARTGWALSWFLGPGVWLDWIGRILIGSCPKCIGEALREKEKRGMPEGFHGKRST